MKRFVILGRMPTVYGMVAVTSQSMGYGVRRVSKESTEHLMKQLPQCPYAFSQSFQTRFSRSVDSTGVSSQLWPACRELGLVIFRGFDVPEW